MEFLCESLLGIPLFFSQDTESLAKIHHNSPADDMTPEYRQQLAVVEAYLDKLQKGFSFAFLDKFWSEVGRLSAIESDGCFRAGLYLGANLILALSQPPARIPRP